MKTFGAVIWDFFGVLCSEVAPVWLGERFEPERALAIKERVVGAADRGALSLATMFGELARITSGSAAEIEREWLALAEPDVATIQLVRNVRHHGRVALLSNAPVEFIDRLLARDEYRGLFDATIVSSVTGTAKPDPEIYRTAANACGVPLAGCLFIDDNVANVDAAQRVGMTAVLHVNAAETATELRQLGVL